MSLRLANGVLTAEGTASADWIAGSVALAAALTGVDRYDPSAAVESTRRRVIAELEGQSVLFERGTTTLAAGADRALADAVDRIRGLDALARVAASRFTVEIVGHADADGPDGTNVPLSERRAARVLEAVHGLGLRAIDPIAIGVGSREPKSAGGTEADKQQNRRVSFRVRTTGGAGRNGSR